MSRFKIFLKTSNYLKFPIWLVLMLAIICLIGFVFDSESIWSCLILFLMSTPLWLVEWIMKRKYFGDVIFKRLKMNKGKVIFAGNGKIREISCLVIIVVNQNNGLVEKFKYFNFDEENKMKKNIKIKSIEFVYLDKSKVIVEVIDLKLKGRVQLEDKRKIIDVEEFKDKTNGFEEVVKMKRVIRKVYRNFEKEIDWLNEMSESGLALCEYTWGRYVFEKTVPREYIFTIEPLRAVTSAAENIYYIESLQKSDVEVISGSKIWLYLRKKTSDGPFGKKIEIKSRIDHYRRDYSQKRIGLFFFLITFISNGILGLMLDSNPNLIIEIIVIPIGIISTYSVLKVKNKIIKLVEKYEKTSPEVQ